MSQKRLAAAPDRPPTTLAWWADRTHRYGLPAAGAISVTLGLSLAIGARFPWDAYLPLVLVVLGVGVLTSALAHHETRKVPAPPTVLPAERYIADTLVICPSCSARSFEATSTPAPPPGAWRVPDPLRPVGTSATPGSPTANPGDFLWASWLPETGRLPVELVGPVPETVYAPPRPKAPTLHEEGEPLFVGTPGTGTPPSGVPGPATPERTGLSARSWTNPEAIEPEPDVPTGTPGWKAVGSSALDLPISDLLLQEALNPVPPHLRPASTVEPVPPPNRVSAPWEPPPPGQCADCGDPVADPASWRRCSDCRHVLCAGCLVGALLTRERAWCSHCAELRDRAAQ